MVLVVSAASVTVAVVVDDGVTTTGDDEALDAGICSVNRKAVVTYVQHLNGAEKFTFLIR